MKNSKYSDDNLFFNGTKNVYSTKDYIDTDHTQQLKHQKSSDFKTNKFLRQEDKHICFLIMNRDLVDEDMNKVDSDIYQVGKFID